MRIAEPLDVIVAEGCEPGPTVCIVGGVHGDEPAGVSAVRTLRSECVPQRGRLMTVVANSTAYRERRRFVDSDLNRAFSAHEVNGHEKSLANDIIDHLRKVDFVLDLHSTSAASPVFGAGANTVRHLEFAAAIGLEFYTYGWSEPRSHSMLIDAADRLGAIGLLVECGDHHRIETEHAAVRCAMRALAWLKICTVVQSAKPSPPRIARVVGIMKAAQQPLSLSATFHNFESILAGTEVCRSERERWIARTDFIILIPSARRVAPGEDAFAIGQWCAPSGGQGEICNNVTGSCGDSGDPVSSYLLRVPLERGD